MQITRKSPFSGELHTLEIDCSVEQLTAWQNGVPIQEALAHLSPAEREFIKTGITAAEWEEAFGHG